MRFQKQLTGPCDESDRPGVGDGLGARMSRHMAPVMLGLTAFPLAAIGIAAYLVVTGGPVMTPVAGAILLLSCCILVATLVAMVKLSRHEAWLWSQQSALRSLSAKTEEAMERLAAAEQRLDDNAAAAEHRAISPQRQRPDAAAPQPKAKPANDGREQLTLLLEPVVELASGATSHYRALVGLDDGHCHMVDHGALMAKAEQGGMRAALDLRMVKMVAPVLRRLRLRNPGLRIFLPVGRATLSSAGEAGRLLALLQKDADVAQAMVFEFAQQDLGSLDAAGIENLARLARAGTTLALREVYLGGLDLAALRQLGVRYLSFPPHAVDAGSGPSQAWNDFAGQARTLQIQVLVDEVKTAQQASAVSRVARYGSGPFFAPPRKVRPDAGVAPDALRQANVA